MRRVTAGESIQKVVDAAHPGDLVLIEPGVYHQEVIIDTERITLRGTERNEVVLDGQGTMSNGVFVSADGVTVENLTVHDYTSNGVVFTGVSGTGDTSPLDGFRMAYLTVYNNGFYGLYAFQASNGVIELSYTSGHPDSGIYVGQCGRPAGGELALVPCNIVVRDVLSEFNAVGYEGTNASQVWLVNSVFRRNRIGITPNSQSLENFTPQTEATIAGNLVIDNNEPNAPEQASGGFGLGIAVGSGTGNVILRNRVQGHEGVGIAVTALDKFTPKGNRIEGNVAVGNRVDLGYWQVGGETALDGNCFAGNTFVTSSPDDIESVMPCEITGAQAQIDAPAVTRQLSPPGPKYREVVVPGPQTTMSGDITVFPPVPAFELPSLDAIKVPAAP